MTNQLGNKDQYFCANSYLIYKPPRTIILSQTDEKHCEMCEKYPVGDFERHSKLIVTKWQYMRAGLKYKTFPGVLEEISTPISDEFFQYVEDD